MLRHYPVLARASRLREAANRFLTDELAKAGLSDITTACGDIFAALYSAGPMTLTALAKRIRRTKATASVMVDRLERLGYVRRTDAIGDKRMQLIELTDAGRAFEPQMNDIAQRLNERLLAGFSEAEAEMLSALLLRALENFDEGGSAS